MKYQPPFDPTMLDPEDGIYNEDADASYVNGDPRIAREGSIPPAEAFEHPLRELHHLIENAGLTPDHEDLEQVRKAVEEIIKRSVLGVGEGTYPLVGYDNTTKNFWVKSISAGANITITPTEDPVGSGKYRLVIAAASGGGGGGGGAVPHANVGTGAEVYKGFNTPNEEFRTLLGTNGLTVTQNTNDVTVSGDKLRRPRLLLEERQASGTGGGTFAPGDWRKRVLNTEVYDPDSICTLSSGQITLPAGTYYVEAGGVGYSIDMHQLRLYDVTNSAALLYGTTAYSGTVGATNHDPTESRLAGVITLAGATVLELQQRCSASESYSGEGFGRPHAFGSHNLYAWLRLN